jgi:hypothetical protein
MRCYGLMEADVLGVCTVRCALSLVNCSTLTYLHTRTRLTTYRSGRSSDSAPISSWRQPSQLGSGLARCMKLSWSWLGDTSSSAEAHRSTYLHPKAAHQQRMVHVTKLTILRSMKCGKWQLLCITDCYVMSQNQLGLVVYLLLFIAYLKKVSVTQVI